ncbi:MAG: hypothetical protein U0R51_03105 [Solirubrobacterales bacterium]
MRTVRVQDLVAQSVVSILNLSARRILKEDERDLEQAQVGIEAIRGMVDVLDPDSQREIEHRLRRSRSSTPRPPAAAVAAMPRPRAGPRNRVPARDDPGGRAPPVSGLPVRTQGRTSTEPHLQRPLRVCSPGFSRPSGHCRDGFLWNPTSMEESTSELESFLTDHGVVVALVCAAAGVLYGRLSQSSARPPGGNERMLEISGAVRRALRPT